MLYCRLSALFACFILATMGESANADMIYVSNNGNNTIEQFTLGGVGSTFANTGLNQPYGLAIDSTGLDSPTYIAIAVPEPSSFILAGLCAAVVFCGWQFNRRRNLGATSE
jgi:hypothetical protein